MADVQLLGCAVPRRHRGNRGNRNHGSRGWSSQVGLLLGDHHMEDGSFHDDEREALEALCFLSAGSCQPPAEQDGQQQQLQLPQQPSKGKGKAADKQQHSKGSSTTADPSNPSSSKAAATSRPLSSKQMQLTRQNSPGSDVSSGGCQASLVPANSLLQPLATQQHKQHELPLPLEEIHPAALPDAGLLLQQLPANPATNAAKSSQDQQQQRQQKNKAGASPQQTKQREQQQSAMQQPLPQYVPEQLVPSVPGSSLPGATNSWSMPAAPTAAAPTGMPFGPYAGLPGGQSSLLPSPAGFVGQQALLGPAPADSGAAAAAMAAAAFAALGLKQSPIQAQLASLMPPDLLQHAALASGSTPAQLAAAAAMTAAATGGAAPGLAVGLPQLLLSAGTQPAGLAQLLEGQQLLQQALGLGQHLSGQQQGIAGSGSVKRPPVKGCYWHVYIANMIAEKQRAEEQQQQQPVPEAVNVKLENDVVGGETAQQRDGIIAAGANDAPLSLQTGAMRPPTGPQQQLQLQQRRASPASSGSPRVSAGAVRKAEELALQGSPTKRHKKLQQQQQGQDFAAIQMGQQQQKPADLLGLLNNSGNALLQASSSPAFGLAMAAAAAAAAGQPGALSLLPQLPVQLPAAAPAARPLANNPFLVQLPQSASPTVGMPHPGCSVPAPDWLAAAAAAAAVGGQGPHAAGDLLLQLLGPRADGQTAAATVTSAAGGCPAPGLLGCMALPGIAAGAGAGLLLGQHSGAAAQQQQQLQQQLHALKLALRNVVGGEQALVNQHISQHGLLAQ